MDTHSSPGSPEGSAEGSADDGAPVFTNIGEMLQFHTRSAPERAAILSESGAIVTYAGLSRFVSVLLRNLRGIGIGPHDRVAVVLPRGTENALTLVAVAAGAVCIPVNPEFTTDELLRYFSELRLTCLITRTEMSSPSRGVAHTLGIPFIDLSFDDDTDVMVTGQRGGPAVSAGLSGAADDAFILLTSGTASRPKMVPLTQASVCRSAYNAGAVLRLKPTDRLLNALPMFHAHGLISGLLTALAAGSSVIVTSGFDPASFYRGLRELQPSWYTAVPTIHRALLSAADQHADDIRACVLRVIRSASSSLPPAVLEGLQTTFGVPVLETYGMTEGASQIAANPFSRRKVGSVGLPAGPEIAIMDEHGRPLGPGERGEIMLRGPTMTRGYCDDAAATAAAFREGWFRTGDLGTLDEDGYLFIVGRIKDIINRGGQKVSPEEVEQVLLRHPDVLEAAAFGRPHPRLGESVAVAIVLKPRAKTNVDALRQFATGRLAGYKVPSEIHLATALPKGASGKIKRSALAAAFAAPDDVGASFGRAGSPASDVEAQLAAIWAGLLEIDHVGIDQDIMALGADSILVTQFLSRVRERFGAILSFADVFDAPTVAGLAARLQSASEADVDAASSPSSPWDMPRAFQVAAPLSFQQQRVDFLDCRDPTGRHYNVVEAVRLKGTLVVAALAAALAAIQVRHDVLRVTFSEQRGLPIQTVQPDVAQLTQIDFDAVEPGDRDAISRREVLSIVHRRFDRTAEPPCLATLLRFADDDHVLVAAIHHVATDGWSQRLFWNELRAHYAHHCGLADDAPAPLSVQYGHYVAWQQRWLRSQAAKDQVDYWHEQLDGLTALPLRGDHPRPAQASGRGARHKLVLPAELSAAIRDLSRAEGVTPFMVLLAALQCLLHRMTGHDDIAVGSLIANRNQVQTERLIGMFANTIVLRSDLSGDLDFRGLLARVRRTTLDAYRNQDLPIEEVLRTLPLPRGSEAAPLFKVMFILQNATASAPTLPDIVVEPIEVDPQIARCDLSLELSEGGAGYSGFLEYSTDLFETDTVARIASQFEALLQAVTAHPDEKISQLRILPQTEHQSIATQSRGAQIDFAAGGDVAARFADQFQRAPDAVAVSDALIQLSYRALAARSSAIAGWMGREGLGADDVVALLGPRTPGLIAAMLGAVSAGVAFLCLDPDLPPTRLAQILADSGARHVLASQDSAGVLARILDQMPAAARPSVAALEDHRALAPSGFMPPAHIADRSLAYVIYTSGSSGAPKAALITRRGLSNHLASLIHELGLSPTDVIAQTAPQSFVVSIWQSLAGLMAGARIHVVAGEMVRDPVVLAREIRTHGITVLQIVPSLLRALLARADEVVPMLSGLRILIVTGEPLAADLCRDWFALCPGVPLVNAYGASECSDDVTLHRMISAPASGQAVPIGRPLPNVQVHVLDTRMQPVPIGVVGELCVGGAGVGRGYLGDPGLTAKRFITDPFTDQPEARLYLTGDLGRWRADGTLECLGRSDRQIKIRGHRIELKEIEQALLDHPKVLFVVVEPRGEAADQRLVAYLSIAPGNSLSAADLREHLKSRLPLHMVPAAFLFLDQLPLNAHGKIDRAALRAVEIEEVVAHEAQTLPRHATEALICEIWADVLKRRKVGITDNFFDLGGHSLLAGQVMTRIADALHVALPIKALFEAPTVASLAMRVTEAAPSPMYQPAAPIPRRDRDGQYAPSFAQAQMIAMEHALPGLPQFNLPFAFRLQGRLNVRALARSLDEIVRRHEALRTAFAADGATATILNSETIDSILTVEKLGGAQGSDNAARVSVWLTKTAKLHARQEALTPFDVADAPLFRARLLRLGAGDHVLLLTFHHAVVDGWSIGLLLQELSKLYVPGRVNKAASVPEPSRGFGDVAEWQRTWCATEEAGRQSDDWRRILRGAAPVLGTPGRSVAPRLGARTGHEAVRIAGGLVKRLEAFAREQNGTLFMSLLTGLNALLLLRTGRRDICIATSMANRTHADTSGLVGPCENTVIIRSRLHDDLSFAAAFNHVRLKVLDAHARQELPFNILAERLAQEDGIDPASLIQVYFTLQNPLRQPLRLPGMTVRSFGDVFREGQPALPVDQTWLSLMLKERPSGISGSLGYKADLFEADAAAEWVVDFGIMLERAIANPHAPLARLLARRAA